MVETWSAKVRRQDQQCVLDCYTYCLPGGVKISRGGGGQNKHGWVAHEAVFYFNNWLIPLTSEPDPSPI